MFLWETRSRTGQVRQLQHAQFSSIENLTGSPGQDPWSATAAAT